MLPFIFIYIPFSFFFRRVGVEGGNYILFLKQEKLYLKGMNKFNILIPDFKKL